MQRPQVRTATSKFSTIVVACVVIAALYFSRDILIPLALAVLICFLLAPLVSALEKIRFPRVLSVLLVVAGLLALLTTIGWIANTQIANLAENADAYKGNIVQKIGSFQPRNSVVMKLMNAASEVAQIATTQATQPISASSTQPAYASQQHPIPVNVVDGPASPFATLSKYLALALGPLGTAGLVLVFVIFMLIQREDLRDRIISLVGYSQLTLTTEAIDDAAFRVSRYLLMQSVINTCYAICISFGLYLIGIPNAVLWGVLAGVLRFIPYVGPWIGATFPLLLSIAVFPDNFHFVYTISLFVVVELLVSQFLEPVLYGGSTGLTPIAVLVAAVFWAWLWGPVGLLLSTPLTVLIVVIGKYIPQLAFLNILLGDEPVLQPHLRYYQRLLAGDAEEAEEVIDEYLKKMPLEDVYDQVVIAALATFKKDLHNDEVDETKHQFILSAVRDQIEQLSQLDKKLHTPAAKPSDAKSPSIAPLPSAPFGTPDIHIICLPASDEIDGLVASLTAHVLELRGFSSHAATAEALASEMLDLVDTHQSQIVCISAVPPGAVLHARYLCKRLRPRFPDTKLLIALWEVKGDPKRAQERIACSGNVAVVTTMRQLMEQVHQLTQTVKVQQEPPNPPIPQRPAIPERTGA